MTGLRHILLAEDNANDVELTLAALRTNRVLNEVAVTRDGAETLDYLWRRNAYADRDGGNPVLMLLDLKMPKVDGLEVLKAIKEDERTRNIPVIIMTSSKEDNDIKLAYTYGANSYVVKPVGFENFSKAVVDLGMYWMLVNQETKS